ncbi:MAG: helix-turn-helix domain-containing protein [Firmicutes bacterium]|nr:helix-turn-helix domain-containing protein [Bacillota bacterium]
MSIVQRVTKLFDESKKSDYLLEKEIGLKQKSISNWRRGLANPATDSIAKIAKYFDVSADYILGLIDEPKSYDR